MSRVLSGVCFILLLITENGLASPASAAQSQTECSAGTILILGDSLSAGYGIDESAGWVSLLRQRLEEQQIPLEVINASVSGETTSGGVNRLPRLLEEIQPRIVIIELGGNDGLRGYPIPSMRNNLQKTIDLSRSQNADILLVGMLIPPNYGPRYSHLFSESYPLLADKNQVAVVPFILEGIATQPHLMQQDGIHPTAEGQPRMLDNVWEELRPILPQHTNCP
ncbi:arylesterase [Aestuariicella hydrocarbonica]|uniref:Arylesterase n=1 Tax=Pseudomaricurvus hydrocarbonicus TaxID=1470433 RepID=A0A9E5JSD9_9GAMM|nr:arylesterase [Aestuariicella hydrocarbonica]NHO64516.1 arylesterase [Aestuariicella hydrocarbonica]